jgi:diadenosine tetraphosphate (Ap4A) HIT family hydrolase
MLVVPRSHVASLDEAERSLRTGTLELARGAARLLRGAFGEAGIYEHGGSPICRPRSCQGGPTHAHLHVLPVAEDVLVEQEPQEAGGSVHYLYQEIDGASRPERQDLGPAIPSHLIRSRLQYAMAERGMHWLPMGADRRFHLAAIRETVRLTRIDDGVPGGNRSAHQGAGVSLGPS